MKKAKLLIPALAIASVGATVAPIVTSCNKGLGGIKLTDEEMIEMGTYYATHVANYTATGTYDGDEVVLKADGIKESTESDSKSNKTEYFQWDSATSKMQKHNGTGWVEAEDDDLYPTVFTGIIALALASGNLEYKNGAYRGSYQAGGDKLDLIVVIKKVKEDSEDVNRVTHIEIKIDDMLINFEYTDYGTTTISDFPS